MKLIIVFFVALIFLNGVYCKKDKQTELEKLPPITQNGANTFGCLINGRAYIPKGYSGNMPNYYVLADPGFSDGDLSIRTYSVNGNLYEGIAINSDSIKQIGTYLINDTGRTRIILLKSTADLGSYYCDISYTGYYQRNGILKITKYDMQNGIISGEFAVSMVNRDCGYGDTIKITEGRFDYKL